MNAGRIWLTAAILVAVGPSPAMAQQAQPPNSMSFWYNAKGTLIANNVADRVARTW